ncbi:MAG: transcriptional activator RfaH [Rhodobacterales bacterium]
MKNIVFDMNGEAATDQWFLVQIKPNMLHLAQRNLIRQKFDVFCPTLQTVRKQRGQYVENRQPLFPGYIFIGLDPATAPWCAVNSTYGVTRLVSFGTDSPMPVPLSLVERLQMRCDEDGLLLPPKTLKKGDRIEILSGPFADFVTTIENIEPDQRIWVLLDLFGRPTRVTVDRKNLRLA